MGAWLFLLEPSVFILEGRCGYIRWLRGRGVRYALPLLAGNMLHMGVGCSCRVSSFRSSLVLGVRYALPRRGVANMVPGLRRCLGIRHALLRRDWSWRRRLVGVMHAPLRRCIGGSRLHVAVAQVSGMPFLVGCGIWKSVSGVSFCTAQHRA